MYSDEETEPEYCHTCDDYYLPYVALCSCEKSPIKRNAAAVESILSEIDKFYEGGQPWVTKKS